MSYTLQKILPSSKIIHEKLPLSKSSKEQIEQDRIEIKNILAGHDSRKICIVGPCSAWPSDSVIEYAQALKPIAEKLKDKLKIIMRVYIQKPRTTIGWTGPVNQPDPFAPADIEKGIFYCREMMLKVIQLGFPIADEAVYTHKKGYFTDLYAWMAIGARSTEDQEHRIFASMIDNPVGMKNPTSGNLKVAINSIIAAQFPHVFVINGEQVQTSGNPYAHLILRGGNGKSNYDQATLESASKKIQDKKLKNPAIIVDASHENSIDPQTKKKDPLRQQTVLASICKSMQKNPDLDTIIKGFMIESFLEDGAQNLKEFSHPNDPKLVWGKSVTDGCIGLAKTKSCLDFLAKNL